ncbi:unnamed protein product, partial [Ixodes hexagonus]
YAAKLILASINTTEDPCTDFYTYACGNWQKTHPIPDDATLIGNFQLLDAKVEKDIRDILENATIDAKKQQNATEKAIRAYRVCLSVSEDEKLRDLMDIFKKQGFTTWPILESEETPYKTYAEIINKTSVLPFLSLYVDRDVRNIDSHVIYLDQLRFTLIGRNELIDQETEENAKIFAAYKALIKGTVKLFKNDTTDDKAEQISEDIAKFEAQLANFSKAEEDRRNFTAMYNRMTIGNLSSLSPELEWLQLLNNDFSIANITLEKQESVIVEAPEYFQETAKFLATANISTLYNFIYWKQIEIYGEVASKAFAKLLLDFKKAVLGVEKDVSLWEKCTHMISDLFRHAVGRLYVDKMFDPCAKENMDSLVTMLNSTFIEMLENNTWMDEETRKGAISKLEKMVAKIGYPSWMLNDTYVNGLYDYMTAVSLNESLVKVFHDIGENNAIKMLQNLRKPYQKANEWEVGAAVVNAFYNPMTNDIIFPAAMLQPPFFQYGLPSSINMGDIGAVIGHEITHAFDDGGNQFDADGQLRNWWTADAKREFLDNAKCFIDQYGNVTVEEVNMTLDGINTQGENIADYSGLKAAYLSFKKYKDSDTVIPGLPNLTEEKLFFVSNAMVWCENIRKESLREDIQYDPHSPPQYRVNIPMANFEGFSEAFGCSSTSPMNLINKCKMW